jgi:hypothetical protein
MSFALHFRASFRAALLAGLAAQPFAAGVAIAANYDFLAAPEIDLNRIFRIDKANGEVGACQFGIRDGFPVGITLCYPPGQGAGPQGPSDYALVASRHEKEGGVWRVDLRSGQMSSCYVLNEAVVCTPQAK